MCLVVLNERSQYSSMLRDSMQIAFQMWGETYVWE